MKWFKHYSTMSNDPKIKRLIRRFGVEGYGIYNYILELIVRRLETETPIPDLEETAGDIASDLNMDTVRVEEIVVFCVNQELFESDDITGRVVAHKIYKFLDASTTRNIELKKMIASYKSSVDNSKTLTLSGTMQDSPGQTQTVRDNAGLSGPEETRRDKNRREENTSAEAPEFPDEPQSAVEADASHEESPTSPTLPATTEVKPAPKSLAPLKDPVSRLWEDALTQIQPPDTWGNIAKERKSAQTLGQRSANLITQSPYETLDELITAVLSEYRKLKSEARPSDTYWGRCSYTPSDILARWPQVWTSLASRHEKAHKQREYEESLSGVVF